MLWHMVRGDLRRHRGMLGLWLLLSAGTAGVEGAAPYLVLDPEPASLLGFATVALNLAALVVAVVLAPIVIQSDAFVGSTAFWMTRPIAPIVIAGFAFTIASRNVRCRRRVWSWHRRSVPRW